MGSKAYISIDGKVLKVPKKALEAALRTTSKVGRRIKRLL